jgi:ribosome-binding protein aMBF1 (putative translation factor)
MKKRTTESKTTDAVRILDSMIGPDPKVQQAMEQARVNAAVAQLIYQARTDAGLTQRQLATLAGTKQPVIARLEDADYEGHSLFMLQRIAAALNQRLEIKFAPRQQKKAA